MNRLRVLGGRAETMTKSDIDDEKQREVGHWRENKSTKEIIIYDYQRQKPAHSG